MSKEFDMHLEYMYHHHWGLFIDGELYQEYETYDEAADAYEAKGGIF